MITITDSIRKLRLFTQEHIRGTILGDSLVNVLKFLGLNDFFTHLIYREHQKKPSRSMRQAEHYFSAHEQETDAIASLLADDLSKQVYKAAIQYRITHNPKDKPFFSKHDQYFVKDIVSLGKEEVFIDCGAFDGDTMKEFIRRTKGIYKSIVCFEPVEEYYNRLCKRGQNKNVSAICAGVYKKSTTLYFNADNGKGSSISASASEHTISIPVRSIDATPECRDATFIKMDVEGSEMDALIGAKETILRNKPKLAICLYHKHKDFVEIPLWIHHLIPDYQLYVRHHSFSINETVLYAIPKK